MTWLWKHPASNRSELPQERLTAALSWMATPPLHRECACGRLADEAAYGRILGPHA